MNIPDRIKTANAESNFVIANTPSFLVRRLKEDQAVYLLSQSLSEGDLLKGFVSSSSREPESMRELVTPYLCLCALSLKPTSKYLRDALLFEARPEYKWLKDCAQILIDEFRPVSISKVKSYRVENGAPIPKSGASTRFSTVNLTNQ
jgi:hypothetical protein